MCACLKDSRCLSRPCASKYATACAAATWRSPCTSKPPRPPPVEIHRDVAAAYLRAAEELAPRVQPAARARPRRATAFARRGGRCPEQPTYSTGLDEEALERLSRQLAACLNQALQNLEQMREVEGQSLANEMRALLIGISEKTALLDPLVQRSLPLYAQRLKSRIEELLGAGPLEPSRLAQEAALLAERADVSEELARLRSHTGQFASLLDGGGELGKKLDFLLQEMQREANTLLSKTPGLGEEGLAITEFGLQIKAEIEKLREQIQNVEYTTSISVGATRCPPLPGS